MQTSPVTLENLNFGIIREDGQRACFVGPDGEGLGTTYEDWEEYEGISVEQLMKFALTGERVFIREGEPPYTVGAYITLPEQVEEKPSYDPDDWLDVQRRKGQTLTDFHKLGDDERDHVLDQLEKQIEREAA